MIKSAITLTLFLFLSTIVISKEKFVQGYIVNNSNEKVECLIEFSNLKHNPSSIKFKYSNSSNIIVGKIDSIQEFGTLPYVRYVRQTVQIDRSSQSSSNYSLKKQPQFETETLFLRVIIEGTGSLFDYSDTRNQQFFYSKNGSNPEPLVQKKYLNINGEVKENNQYKNQMQIEFNNLQLTQEHFTNLRYTQRDLMHLIDTYNRSTNSEIVTYPGIPKKDFFRLNIRPGLNFSKMLVYGTQTDQKRVQFDPNTSGRIGIESEFILPFSENWITLFFEISNNSFTGNYSLPDQDVSIKYRSIEIPIGIRYYFPISNKSKVFANVSYILNFDSESKIVYENAHDFTINSENNLGFGIGYLYNNKFGILLNIQSAQNILSDYNYWKTDYTTTSVIFSYTLF